MPNESINVNYSSVKDWGNGFEGEIYITNNGDRNLDSWDLEFDLANEITGIWDAQIIGNDNGSYTIKHESWNREIKSGETITINFVSNGSNNTPQNFEIDGSTFDSPSSYDSIYSFSNPNIGSDLSLGQSYQGRATFYDAANPTGGRGNSGYDIPYGNLAGITAINNIQWNGSSASGAFLLVSGPRQREGAAPIVVQVSDLLYERADGLDLSAEAFARVADPVDGVVNIDYELIGPGDDFQTPYGYTIGQGIVAEGIPESNPWYGAVRLNNHRYPIESIDLLTEGGGTVPLKRGSDNRFTIENGAIYGAQDLLVTDIFGQQVTLYDIDIANGSSADIVTGQQFSLI
ncbi:cellulose binding domain-containing protein [Waterburya agarophytonicola K14]|uniref:Cellulose binding domain-containing protein n=1 Tax=Waterburya agarophytonicola KI4 TaxID=2874699 RepID=A0A964FGE6_9CYAN|nr:expansin EXLX1 family cellulose-binding protein [Waterburya agarophytonicola]MCC0177926.1 cellulose binding domain-containing protein [Waterburya agarophytonicola KI4]